MSHSLVGLPEMRFIVSKDFLSVLGWALVLSAIFLVSKPAIGYAAIICCMYFTFYLFSDFSDARTPIHVSLE